MVRKAKLELAAVVAAAAVALPAVLIWSHSAEAAAVVPPAATVEHSAAGREVAILAGGCFWGVEAVFEHVKGVSDVRSGFAGGSPKTGNYSEVSGGKTKHAEVVRIEFDPKIVNYADLLRIFFAVAHDPTQVNRQGPDVGPQYRSAIFPQSAAQQRVARAYIAQLGRARVFPKPVATKLEQGRFIEAGAAHQDFMRKNPAHPYVVAHDRPKLAALKRQFPASWKG